MSGLPLGIVQPSRGHPGKMILTETQTSKFKKQNPCPLAALMLPSSFVISILILCFTRAFMNSLSSASLPLLLCHLLLPVTSESRLLERVAPKQRFCCKSTNLHLSFNFVTAEWDIHHSLTHTEDSNASVSLGPGSVSQEKKTREQE